MFESIKLSPQKTFMRTRTLKVMLNRVKEKNKRQQSLKDKNASEADKIEEEFAKARKNNGNPKS